MPKYNNKKVCIEFDNGSAITSITFSSKAEAVRGTDLFLLEKAGVISELEYQPNFLIHDSFKRNGKTIRAIKYIADFQYIRTEDGSVIVEDVKGMKTSVYQMKKKMFLKKYGDQLIFREVYISSKKTEIKEI